MSNVFRLIGRRHNSAIELYKAEPFDIMNLSSDEDLVAQISQASSEEDSEGDEDEEEEEDGLELGKLCVHQITDLLFIYILLFLSF